MVIAYHEVSMFGTVKIDETQNDAVLSMPIYM